MRSQQFEDGRRNGIKACVEWLHKRADEMNDPHARGLLNVTARDMGCDFKADNTPFAQPEPPPTLPVPNRTPTDRNP